MTRTPPVIVPLDPGHLDQVVALEARVQDRPWSTALFTTEMAQPSRRYLTAWTDEDPPGLLGYGGVLVAVDEAHITTLVVDPTARRRGIASRLLLDLIDVARDMGATAATLEVRAGNHAAQALYRGFGFVEVGVRPRYYAPTGEDAVIMWAHDLDGGEMTTTLRRRRAALDGAGLQDAVVGEGVR